MKRDFYEYFFYGGKMICSDLLELLINSHPKFLALSSFGNQECLLNVSSVSLKLKMLFFVQCPHPKKILIDRFDKQT